MNQMIDIAAYEAVIGRKPRGYGLWRFVIGATIYRYTGTLPAPRNLHWRSRSVGTNIASRCCLPAPRNSSKLRSAL